MPGQGFYRTHRQRTTFFPKRTLDKVVIDIQCVPNNGFLPTSVHYQVYTVKRGEKSLLCQDIQCMTDLGETEALLLQLYLIVRIAKKCLNTFMLNSTELEICIHNFVAYMQMSSQMTYLNDICKEQIRLVKNLAAVLGFKNLTVTYPERNMLPHLEQRHDLSQGICASYESLGLENHDMIDLSLKIRRTYERI